MSDSGLRELERTWEQSGDLNDEVALVGTRWRRGVVSPGALCLALHHDSPCAKTLNPPQAPFPPWTLRRSAQLITYALVHYGIELARAEVLSEDWVDQGVGEESALGWREVWLKLTGATALESMFGAPWDPWGELHSDNGATVDVGWRDLFSHTGGAVSWNSGAQRAKHYWSVYRDLCRRCLVPLLLGHPVQPLPLPILEQGTYRGRF